MKYMNDIVHTIVLLGLCSCGGAAFELGTPDPVADAGPADTGTLPDRVEASFKLTVDAGPDVQVDAAAPVTARSCADISTHIDGVYTIDVDGPAGPNPPFAVYCRNMTTVEPTEYLELPANVDAGLNSNFSGFAGWAPQLNNPCPALTLSFTKVRLVVPNLVIDTTDRTFATLSPQDAGSCIPQAMGYAFAGSCQAAGDTSGRGNVDLVGTPFRMAAATMFAVGGYGGTGIANFSPDRKHVDLMGGGYSGWCSPAANNIQLEFTQ